MKSKGLISQASKLLQSGNFKEALAMYRKAEEVYGNGLFDYNIRLCLENIDDLVIPAKSALNDYFDLVYVVNLEHQVANRIQVANQLNKSGIRFEVFSATNGYEGKPLQKWEEYKQQPLGNLTRYPDFNEREITRDKKIY